MNKPNDYTVLMTIIWPMLIFCGVILGLNFLWLILSNKIPLMLP